jgi:hypothetical protein
MQGYEVSCLNSISEARQLVAKKRSAYILLVGSPYVAPNSEYYLPSKSFCRDVVMTGRKVATGFPVGKNRLCAKSDHLYFNTDENHQYILGRFPVKNSKELETVVQRVLNHKPSLSENKKVHCGIISGKPGFGFVLDFILYGVATAAIASNSPWELIFSWRSVHLEFENALTEIFALKIPRFLVLAGHGNQRGFSFFQPGSYPWLPEGVAMLFLMACSTGLQSCEGFAELSYLQETGPTGLFFSSGVSHPVTDLLFAEALSENFGQNPIGKWLFGFPSSNTVVENIAEVSLNLSEENMKTLKQWGRLIYHYYGDPTQD